MFFSALSEGSKAILAEHVLTDATNSQDELPLVAQTKSASLYRGGSLSRGVTPRKIYSRRRHVSSPATPKKTDTGSSTATATVPAPVIRPTALVKLQGACKPVPQRKQQTRRKAYATLDKKKGKWFCFIIHTSHIDTLDWG